MAQAGTLTGDDTHFQPPSPLTRAAAPAATGGSSLDSCSAAARPGPGAPACGGGAAGPRRRRGAADARGGAELGALQALLASKAAELKALEAQQTSLRAREAVLHLAIQGSESHLRVLQAGGELAAGAPGAAAAAASSSGSCGLSSGGGDDTDDGDSRGRAAVAAPPPPAPAPPGAAAAAAAAIAEAAAAAAAEPRLMCAPQAVVDYCVDLYLSFIREMQEAAARAPAPAPAPDRIVVAMQSVYLQLRPQHALHLLLRQQLHALDLARVREERAALKARLQELLTAAPPAGPLAPPAACCWPGGGGVEYAEILDGLEALLRRELVLHNTLHWAAARLLPRSHMPHALLACMPFWPDLEALIRAVCDGGAA
ncbi:MAG: hypothetical protein J3K34DRAFT_524390 [Monoraphidium minutum]|nr:MAG: hypothetical protein J3K34DRAFT_524390 [Monoraphidium minutum]